MKFDQYGIDTDGKGMSFDFDTILESITEKLKVLHKRRL